jgi:hypothetical protein
MHDIEIPQHSKKTGERLVPFTGSLSPAWIWALNELRRELPRQRKNNLQPQGSLVEYLSTDYSPQSHRLRRRMRELVSEYRRTNIRQHRS